MLDEVSNAELARRLDRLLADLDELKRSQQAYVLREVHEAHRLRHEDRITQVERDTEALEAQHRSDLAELETQRRTMVRWVVGVVIVPVVLAAVQILLSLQGPP